jgi:hypothetical protein
MMLRHIAECHPYRSDLKVYNVTDIAADQDEYVEVRSVHGLAGYCGNFEEKRNHARYRPFATIHNRELKALVLHMGRCPVWMSLPTETWGRKHHACASSAALLGYMYVLSTGQQITVTNGAANGMGVTIQPGA